MKKIITLCLGIFCLFISYAQDRALHFDGIDDHVIIPDHPSLHFTNQLTVELWIRPTGATADVQTVLSKGDNPSFAFLATSFWDVNDQVFFDITTTDGYFSVVYTLTSSFLHSWHHLAATYDGSFLTLYVDGVQADQVAATGSIVTEALPVYIGVYDQFNSFPYNGTIDEVRIWNIARSEADIQARKNIEIASSTPGLVSYFQMNQGVAGGTNTTETTLFNASSAVNGTLNDFALSGPTSNWINGFTNPIILPVSVLSFTAAKNGNMIVLQWNTVGEQEILVYEIEKSTDGTNFSKTGKVLPTGNAGLQTYRYTDQPGTQATLFYRLKIIEADNSFSYSKVVAIQSGGSTGIDIFPNPVKSLLRISTALKGKLNLTIYNAEGRVVITEVHMANAGITIIPVNVDALPAGTYFIRLNDLVARFNKH